MASIPCNKPGPRPSRLHPRFGELIEERRLALGLSRRALAAAIGVSPSMIHYWESGAARRLPSDKMLLALSETLSLRFDRLLTAALSQMLLYSYTLPHDVDATLRRLQDDEARAEAAAEAEAGSDD
jgi:transcriptional regulator with XRE-family HTH domain